MMVKTDKSGIHVYTTKSWQKGEQILKFEGKVILSCMASTRRSISISQYNSFEWPADNIQSYINHSCDSNCFIDFDDNIPVLIARWDIACDREIFYNYNTVDYNRLNDFAAFHCKCDNKNCVRNIRGYCHLTDKQKEDVKDILSPFIKSLLLV